MCRRAETGPLPHLYLYLSLAGRLRAKCTFVSWKSCYKGADAIRGSSLKRSTNDQFESAYTAYVVVVAATKLCQSSGWKDDGGVGCVASLERNSM